MNETQIKYILNEQGISSYSGKLDLSNKFTGIFMDYDGTIFLDKTTTRVEFDFSNNIIKIYHGKIKNNNFVYDNDGNPTAIESFNAIAGFIHTSHVWPNGQIMHHILEGNKK